MTDPRCIWRSGCPHPEECRSAGMCVPMMRAPDDSARQLAWALDRGDELADWINRARLVITELMSAYEQRVRSQIDYQRMSDAEVEQKRPWACMQYVAAEALLRDQPKAVVELRAPDDSTEQRIHAICKLIRQHTWAGIDESKAVCHGCPAAEDSPYGPGTRGCYLLARGVFNIAAHGTRRGAP